jgi:hypothetical protein
MFSSRTRTTIIALTAAFSFAATAAPAAEAMPSQEYCKTGQDDYDRFADRAWSVGVDSPFWDHYVDWANRARDMLYGEDCYTRFSRPWITNDGRTFGDDGVVRPRGR